MAMATALLQLAESILYVSSLLGDQPRAIDRYIDYFGEGRLQGRTDRAAK